MTTEHIKKDEVKKEDEDSQSFVKENNTPTVDLEVEEEPSKEELFSLTEKAVEEPRIDVPLDNSFEEPVVEEAKEVENVEPEPLQQEQIITVSPLLFSAINYKSKQADAVEKIDEHVNEYVLSSSKTISDNVQTKQKTDWD